MFEILKDGYLLFVHKKNDGKSIGVLTLKRDRDFKDIEVLGEDEMVFLNNFNNILTNINEERALSVCFDNIKNEFVASIKNKVFIGEYNDQYAWNDECKKSDRNFLTAIEKLDEMYDNKIERRNLK